MTSDWEAMRRLGGVACCCKNLFWSINLLVKSPIVTFSANDLGAYIGVERQTIYRMRASGRLPRGFLIGKRIRRWSLPELITHSNELKAAFLPLTQSDTQAANDNEPD